jgi:tol-pal system protein YbgF
MIRGIVLACVAVVAAGCASRGSVRQVGEDVRTLQGEVGALRQSQEDISRRLSEMASANRAAQLKSDPLGASVAAMRADLERLTAKMQATDTAVKEVQDALAARPAAPAPTSVSPTAAEAPKPAEGAKPVRNASAEDAFTAGLANFRNREYGQAVLDFLDVVTKYPRHELAATAQYLIAEAYYLQHDYRQALTEFRRTVQWPRPHPKVADALLKVGLCHSRLSEQVDAQIAWRRVVREFPETLAADEARVLLAGKRLSHPSARR